MLSKRSGVSLLELVVTITILGILAAGVMPLVRNTTIRTKEIELRRNLRIIRIAIDDYKKTYDKVPNRIDAGNGYPKDLQELVDGKDFGDPKIGKVKFLRRKILNPLVDPKISSEDDKWGWELRSYKDDSDSTSWGEDDVFDVYATNEDTIALDGTKYKEW